MEKKEKHSPHFNNIAPRPWKPFNSISTPPPESLVVRRFGVDPDQRPLPVSDLSIVPQETVSEHGVQTLTVDHSVDTKVDPETGFANPPKVDRNDFPKGRAPPPPPLRHLSTRLSTTSEPSCGLEVVDEIKSGGSIYVNVVPISARSSAGTGDGNSAESIKPEDIFFPSFAEKTIVPIEEVDLNGNRYEGQEADVENSKMANDTMSLEQKRNEETASNNSIDIMDGSEVSQVNDRLPSESSSSGAGWEDACEVLSASKETLKNENAYEVDNSDIEVLTETVPLSEKSLDNFKADDHPPFKIEKSQQGQDAIREKQKNDTIETIFSSSTVTEVSSETGMLREIFTEINNTVHRTKEERVEKDIQLSLRKSTISNLSHEEVFTEFSSLDNIVIDTNALSIISKSIEDLNTSMEGERKVLLSVTSLDNISIASSKKSEDGKDEHLRPEDANTGNAAVNISDQTHKNIKSEQINNESKLSDRHSINNENFKEVHTNNGLQSCLSIGHGISLANATEAIEANLARSMSLKDRLDVLKKGTTLYKLRDKGLRGIQIYKRRYWLDLDNLLLKFSPHQEGMFCSGSSESSGESFYSLKDIHEVRAEYTTDIFNKIKHKPIRITHLTPFTTFSLIFTPESNRRELDLVAEDQETRDAWVEAISHLILTLASLSSQKEYELYLKNSFRKADENRSGYLSFSEVKDLCKLFNIKMPKEEMEKLFALANTDKGDTNRKDKGQVLNEDEFISFYYKLMTRPDVDHIFRSYSTVEGRMSPDQLADFFRVEQKYSLMEEECAGIIRHHEPTEDKSSFTLLGFTQFLMFSDLQNIVDPTEMKQIKHSDMVHPLSHYWIASSHNTYLTGNQLNSDSSVDAYINALKQGCRCVELDVWDGDDGEPIIYHGHTLTTKILFKDVVQACHKYAFVKSPYPVILSLENHCGIEQQEVMAEHLKRILGDSLYLTPPDKEKDQLPSPEDLREKILVKAKRLPEEGREEEEEEEDEADDERDEAKKAKKPKVAKKLSDLVNLIHAVHFHGFDNPDAKYYHMSSFGESKTKDLLEAPETARQFVKYNCKQISRIYPGAKRQDSSNLKILPAMAAGCQIVALNYQTDDRQNMINRAVFAANGGCGYILKPEFLRDPSIHYNPSRLNGLVKSRFPRLTLWVEIVSGQHIPRPNNLQDDSSDIIDPYVQLKIRGHTDDFEKEENKRETTPVKNNGLNPVWREEFKFHIDVPDLAILEFKVKDYSKTRGDSHLGSAAVPVRLLQEGYRRAFLVDYSGKQLRPASLFVKIKKKWFD